MIATYRDRARGYGERRDREAHLSAIASRLRLATFLPAAGLTVWMLANGASALTIAGAAVLFAAFAALVVWHSRVDERVAWYEALRQVNLRGIARTERDWNALPAATPPADVDLNHHPYALDLDLFGRASLVQWLGPAATAPGQATLDRWLLAAADRAVIFERQRAIAELAHAAEWREAFAAHGIVASGVQAMEVERFLEWAEGTSTFGAHRGAIRAVVSLLTATIWLLLALRLGGVMSGSLWFLPVIIGIVISFLLGERVHREFTRAGVGQYALGRYSHIFEAATSGPVGVPLLDGLRARLGAEGVSAPTCMRRLNSILGCAALRSGAAILHFVIQAVTLWDFHVVFALDGWRRRAGRRVRGWMAALGELDALAVLAAVQHENPSWCVPVFTETSVLRAAALAHPLIPDDRRIGNDVEVGPPGTILLITGSNMSGKSTLLRAIGLNTVLAHAGACACAASLELPEVELQTSIRIQDSLELGLSYFMAALARLKAVVDAAEHPQRERRVLLYLLDEILQGTNSAERAIAVRGIARHLLAAGAIGAMTTHDLAIAREEPLDRAAQLVHFSESLDEGGAMSFDYRLRPGLATSRNALRLMKMIGIDLEGY